MNGRGIAATASRLALTAATALLLVSCSTETDRGSARRDGSGERGTKAGAAESPDPGTDGAAGAAVDAGSADSAPLVVFLGDSLTAGRGLAEEEAYPARVGERLAAEGLPARVVNAGVSGDTSAGGLARVDWVLRLDPDVVVVELGPNDGLRGLPLDATEDNLRRIVGRIRAAGVQVLLVGLQIPPNYGPDYAGRFRDLYPRLAEELNLPLVPFLLEGVGGEPDLNLPDGLHPNAEGHRRLAANVLPYLRPLVAETMVPGAAAAPPAH